MSSVKSLLYYTESLRKTIHYSTGHPTFSSLRLKLFLQFYS